MHDMWETKETIQRNYETIQQNHDCDTNQLSTLLKLIKREEINEEKALIYNSNDKDYDESN